MDEKDNYWQKGVNSLEVIYGQEYIGYFDKKYIYISDSKIKTKKKKKN